MGRPSTLYNTYYGSDFCKSNKIKKLEIWCDFMAIVSASSEILLKERIYTLSKEYLLTATILNSIMSLSNTLYNEDFWSEFCKSNTIKNVKISLDIKIIQPYQVLYPNEI